LATGTLNVAKKAPSPLRGQANFIGHTCIARFRATAIVSFDKQHKSIICFPHALDFIKNPANLGVLIGQHCGVDLHHPAIGTLLIF
jgi:hypothetical protein